MRKIHYNGHAMRENKTTLDLALFGQRCRQKRGKTSLEEVSQQIGTLSRATLHRIEQGNYLPEIVVFLSLCDWMQENPVTFFVTQQFETLTNYDRLIGLIQSDPSLTQHTKEILTKLMELVYKGTS